MSRTHIGYVHTCKGTFFHSIDTESDAVYLHDHDENVILMYDASCGVWDTTGNRLGTMRLIDYTGPVMIWMFVDNNDVRMEATTANEVILSEIEYSKHYIETVYEGEGV